MDSVGRKTGMHVTYMDYLDILIIGLYDFVVDSVGRKTGMHVTYMDYRIY